MERIGKRSLDDDEKEVQEKQEAFKSLSRSISPPRAKRRKSAKTHASPFRLTWIRDLPEDDNRDAVTLADILGDPMIGECWNFNYLHDVHFLMDAFDKDIRSHVQVHVVHGFWKNEDGNRLQLVEDAKSFPNVHLHVAPMPEMFGTHHSKMLVLFRRDDTAQVIIHTANMIAKDWTNMTNGVWMSPVLPKLDSSETEPAPADLKRGSGQRFKYDLLNYLKSYDRRRPTCTALVKHLREYDFSSIRGSLVASVPGTHEVHELPEDTHWGWDGLAKSLKQVPCPGGKSEIVTQISSIATLGGKDGWLRETLFKALSRSKVAGPGSPHFKVVFPTADEIRDSLDGYASGGSIHAKIQSKQQEMQLGYLRPIFHHWSRNDGGRAGAQIRDAGRDRAAPHIKTYIRYGQEDRIDWALMTSANLSKQAWGEAAKPTGQFRVASWEIGVLVWPALYGDNTVMKACHKADMPETSEDTQAEQDIVGIRVPYSFPLRKYGENETPWVATMAHERPDWMGQSWIV